jgi:hypothetical protein
MLKTILGGTSSEMQLASWLADPEVDGPITEKEATAELAKLVSSRLDLALSGDDLPKWRTVVARYVLATEFRSDLEGDAPKQLDGVAEATRDVVSRARTIADRLREAHSDRYPTIADQAESELNLRAETIDPLALGSIDTFRFEERALLARCGELVREGSFERASEITRQRRNSFWLAEDVERQAQWEAVQLAARLGVAADEVDVVLKTPPKGPADWIRRYADNWYRLDRAQRRREAWLPKLERSPQSVDDTTTSSIGWPRGSSLSCRPPAGRSAASAARRRSLTTLSDRNPVPSRSSWSMRCGTRWESSSLNGLRTTAR